MLDRILNRLRNLAGATRQQLDRITERARRTAAVLGAMESAKFLDTILVGMRRVREEGVNGDSSYDAFAENLDQLMAANGYDASDRRARLVFKNNLRAQQNVAKEETYREAGLPYRVYRHGFPFEARPHHEILDGKTYRADDLNLLACGSHPWGFGCTCSFSARSQGEVDDLGINVEDFPSEYASNGREMSPAVRMGDRLVPLVDPGWMGKSGASPESTRLRNIAPPEQS